MLDGAKYFFVISFTARHQSGMAIVLSSTEREAFACLKQMGQYNGTPNDYVQVAIKNVGKYDGCAYGLVLESYTNAIVAFDAIAALASKIVETSAEVFYSKLVLLSDVEYAQLEQEGRVDLNKIYFVYEEEE